MSGAEKKLRKLARSPVWREKYSVSQAANIPLFDGNVDEWNPRKRQFVAWCAFYYNIFKMDEPPSIDIIEDDRELDNFLRSRELKIRHEKMKQNAQTKLKSGGGSSTHEIFK